MDERLVDLRSKNFREARIKVMQGHFATQNSHINTYIDMSTVKCRQNNAEVSAKALAEQYMLNLSVDTIVCLDETEVIGAFLADELAHKTKQGLSFGNNISAEDSEKSKCSKFLLSLAGVHILRQKPFTYGMSRKLTRWTKPSSHGSAPTTIMTRTHTITDIFACMNS